MFKKLREWLCLGGTDIHKYLDHQNIDLINKLKESRKNLAKQTQEIRALKKKLSNKKNKKTKDNQEDK